MRILSILFLCYFVQFSNCNSLSDLLDYFNINRPRCSCRCGVIQRRSYGLFDKMADGVPHDHSSLPWMAYIHTNETTIPGALISDRHVITAASRVHELSGSDMHVQLGNMCNNNGLNSSVESIIINPGFTPGRRDNDLALVRLRHSVSLNGYITPICMPFSERDYRQQSALVSSISSYEMQHRCMARASDFPLLQRKSCMTNANYTLDKGCLGSAGLIRGKLCQDDKGAPVMTRRDGNRPFRLIGVLSSASCDGNEPSLFTRTNDHWMFINEHTRRDCRCHFYLLK